jgi:serine phosphatase RsbU (regulator of sigma subunit)
MSLSDHLTNLESAGLIRLAQLEPDLEYLFRHALVQDAAYASLLTADQKQLHLAVGVALEELYPDQLEKHAAMLARHFARAGEDRQAHKYFILAGEASLSTYANQEAEAHFRRALALSCCPSKRAGVLENLGEALYRQSCFADALQIWQEGIDLYQSQEDFNGVARLYARSARIAWLNGDTPKSLKLSREGLDAVAGLSESPDLALLMHEGARACLFNGLPEEAMRLCRQALEMAENLGAVAVQADALATLGVLPDQPPEDVLAALAKAVELSEFNGLLQIAVRAHHNLGVMISGLQGDQGAARRNYLRAAEIARQRGVVSEEIYSLLNAVEVSLGLGNFSEVEEMLFKLDQLLNDIPDPAPYRVAVDSIKARLFWGHGDWDQALQLLSQCQVEARQRGDLQRLLNIDNDLASAMFELHQRGELDGLEEVEAVLTEVIEISERGFGGRTWPYSRMSILKARQGKFRESHQWLVGAKEVAQNQPSFWNDLALKTAEAELATAEKRWLEALVAAEEVASLNARIDNRWSLARTLQDWAEIHLLRAEPSDLPRAIALFREAKVLFDEMGAFGHSALVDDKLQALRVDLYAQALAYQEDSQELAQAGEIQASFLPEEIPEIPGWQFAASLAPARETSGDFYDFINLPAGRLGIVVADVAGKGAAAALYMASGRTLIHTFAPNLPDLPERVLFEANRRITEDTHKGLFITAFYGVIDPVRGILMYCNAGHNPPLLLQSQGNAHVQKLTRTGVPLGIVAQTEWLQNSIQLSPGDALVLYSDGVTDAQNSQREFFGEERLVTIVRSSRGRTAKEIHDAIQKDIHDFVDDAPQFDDITLVVLVRDTA